MTKTLIVAEKPSVARDLATALGRVPKVKDKDWFENDDLVIASAVGHVVELFMPDDIDKKYRFWALEALPIIPDQFQLKPIEKNKERFDLLKKLMNRKDVETVVNGCDAGREGELIFANAYDLAKCKKPVKRLWMQSMTKDGIKKAYGELREDETMEPLKDAARSRSEADWLIGINGTRAITARMYGTRNRSKGARPATVGRVQTPTLAMVLERERAIRGFEPRTYWQLKANFRVHAGTYEGMFQKPDFKRGDDEHDRVDRIWDEETARRIAEEVQKAAQGTAEEKKRRSKQSAPRLYDLTTLQREANSRFGFAAGQTLRAAQALYEKHKMITYPRTDSRCLPEDYIPTCKETMGNLEGDLRVSAHAVLENDWIQPDKRIFNNTKISDHFAIIPTGASKKVTEVEAKVYDMIARRFVAAFYPAAEFDVTTRITTLAEHAFKTEGKVLIKPGWLTVYGQDKNKNENLTPLSEEDGNPAQARLAEIEVNEDQTRPPPRYTEATLLSAMEGAGKLVEDEDLADAMKEKGLGTPATRAQIIDHLVSEHYIEREARELLPTGKAEALIDFLGALKVDALTSPTLTGEWEYRLNQMEQGKLDRGSFMEGIADMTKKIVESAKTFEGDEGKPIDVVSFTDGEPILETVRDYRSQDERLKVSKVISNRKLKIEELRTLIDDEKHFLGPIDGFLSKAGKRFSAALQLEEDDNGKFRVKFIFGDAVGSDGDGGDIDLSQFPIVGVCPKDGANVYATPTAYICENAVGNDDTKTCDFRISRRMLETELPEEQVRKLLTEKKTDLIKGFRSRRTGRRFDAHLILKPDGGIGFDFPPRKKKAAKKKAAAKKAAAS